MCLIIKKRCVKMDFWRVFDKESLNADFGSKQILLNTGARHNLSLKMIQDRSINLANGEGVFKKYSYDKRYLLASNLSFDMLVTAFDVNTSTIIAFRSQCALQTKEARQILQKISSIKNPNLELRAIGLQNNSKEALSMIYGLRNADGNTLVEIDIFGDSIRHIVIDTKTGMPYNLLQLNRIYRPGELLNQMKQDTVPQSATGLNFRILD